MKTGNSQSVVFKGTRYGYFAHVKWVGPTQHEFLTFFETSDEKTQKLVIFEAEPMATCQALS